MKSIVRFVLAVAAVSLVQWLIDVYICTHYNF
jgi:hypothetical protein